MTLAKALHMMAYPYVYKQIERAQTAASLLEKAFRQTAKPNSLTEGFAQLGPAGLQELPVTRSAVVMLCDLSPFSKVARGLSSEEIADLLNLYYVELGRLIVDHHGMVEKYIGDGILLMFGDPSKRNARHSDVGNALRFAHDGINLVHRTFSGELNLRVALSVGSLFFGWLGPNSHRELTMVGSPLTEVFRLESEVPAPSIALRTDVLLRAPKAVKTLFRDWKSAETARKLRGVGDRAVDYTIMKPPDRLT